MDLLRVDHLVFTRPELTDGIDELEELCGVRASVGGRHADWGSHNALLSLGPRTYLEIIAPDPASSLPAARRPPVFTVPGRNLINGWVVNHPDVHRATALLREGGCPMGDPVAGRRVLPDGRTLEWTLSDPFADSFDGIMPMLIDWGVSPHPGAGSPTGCTLQGLRLGHPRGRELVRLLERIDVPTPLVEDDEPFIEAELSTPVGPLALR